MELINENTLYFVNCKNENILCEQSVLRHNWRNCFPSYLDHYLKYEVNRKWTNNVPLDPHFKDIIHYFGVLNQNWNKNLRIRHNKNRNCQKAKQMAAGK